MIKEAIITIALALGQVPNVVDGDTIKIANVRIRLVDFDTPEIAGKCPKEQGLAWQARRELQNLLILSEGGAVKMSFKLVPCAYANWGRLCAEATLDGKPLAQHMIRLGFASSYICRPGYCPPKINWCAAPRPAPSPNAVRTWKFPDYP
jgi:endonuclease YncB( thermonuclease family)